MLDGLGMLDGPDRLGGDNVLGSARLDICDQLFSNRLADPLGMELL